MSFDWNYNWEFDSKQDIETYIDWDIDTKINTEINKDVDVNVDIDVDVKENSAFIEGVIKDFDYWDGYTNDVTLMMDTTTIEDKSSLSMLHAQTENVTVQAVSSASDNLYYYDSATFTEIQVHIETTDHFTVMDFSSQSVTDG